jgi:hypothetical protein
MMIGLIWSKAIGMEMTLEVRTMRRDATECGGCFYWADENAGVFSWTFVRQPILPPVNLPSGGT